MIARNSLIFLTLSILLIQCGNRGHMPRYPTGSEIATPRYTRLFNLAFHSGDTFVILRDPEDSLQSIGAFVWGKGQKKHKGFTRITDRNRLVVLSAVFTGMLEAFHAENRIVAVDNGDYISSPRTVKAIRSGRIAQVADESEKIARQKPGLVLAYYIDIRSRDNLKALSDKGIPVMFLQNFLEAHPLGRAEWMLLIGALCGRFSEAAAMFDEVEEHYLSTKARVPEGRGPTVLVNAPFSGVWDVPSGGSYMAQLIKDAGGAYVFSEHQGTGRIPMDIEKVFRSGAGADIWLNPGVCRDTACLQLMDRRITGFSAYRNQRIYNCTRQLKPNGANAWWDYGVMRPDLVLLDLFSIMHPEKEFQHQPVFFENIFGP